MRVRTSLITLAGLVLVLSACTNSASSEATCFRGPRQWGPRCRPPRRGAGQRLAAVKVRLHLARRGDPVRQARLRLDPGAGRRRRRRDRLLRLRDRRREGLACAQNLKVQQVQAVLNFQLFEDSSPEIAAYGDLPTIAIDIHQALQVAFMGADNTWPASSPASTSVTRSRPRTTASTRPSSPSIRRVPGPPPKRASTA